MLIRDKGLLTGCIPVTTTATQLEREMDSRNFLVVLCASAFVLFASCGGGDTGPQTCEGDACFAGIDTGNSSDMSASVDQGIPVDEGNTTACNPVTGSGCEEGFHCIFNEQNNTLCEPNGATAVGEECKENSDCAEGICANLQDSGQLCYPFCNGPINCPSIMPDCVGLLDVEYQLCVPEGEPATACDLLAQDCDGGYGCYMVGDDTYPGCYPSGEGTLGDQCTSANGCGPGFICINATCLTVCDTSAEEPCEDDANCANYYGPQNAGYCGFSG